MFEVNLPDVEFDSKVVLFKEVKELDDLFQMAPFVGTSKKVKGKVRNILLGLDFRIRFKETVKKALDRVEGVEKKHTLIAPWKLLVHLVQEHILFLIGLADQNQLPLLLHLGGDFGVFVGQEVEELVQSLQVLEKQVFALADNVQVRRPRRGHLDQILLQLLTVPVGEKAQIQEEFYSQSNQTRLPM